MTSDELWSLIQSDPDAKELARVGDDVGCAARCSVIAPLSLQETKRAYRGLTSTKFGVGTAITRRLIVSIRTVAGGDPLVDEMQTALRSSSPDAGIDVSDPGTHELLDVMASLNIPFGITAEDAAAIKALGMQPQTFTADDVRHARR